ncbi:MAG: UDP-3-O-acyl-N-acetylglucosamine deacetylase [Leptolyngbya sp. RL_3_1]|nr:UDP-3-O-acyl-N-acetylglucosamine deacetylase [Leptolyngbya sp. RL_3_1]
MAESNGPTPAVSVAQAVPPQATLAQPLVQAGVGLHSGQETTVRILPVDGSAAEQTGRYFVRTDLPGQPTIPAQVSAIGQTLLSTELAAGAATVRTVEHLLAALVTAGVSHARIEIDGPEVPLLDGSALPWVTAIAQAGLQAQAAVSTPLTVTVPVHIQEGDAFVMALPSSVPRFTYGIDFDVAAIGNQWHSWSPDTSDFAEAIAPARTFGLAYQVDYLRAQGLIKGGSLENALVCDHTGWVNPPLRFDNEPVRHKLLDLVGDLSLMGMLPLAHVVAYKASHGLHVKLAQALMAP